MSDNGKWLTIPLIDVASFQNGHAFYKDGYSDDGLIAIDLYNVSEDGKLRLGSRDKRVSPELCEKYSRFILDRGDLVIVMTDMTQKMGILGKCAKIDKDNSYILNQRIGRIVPDETQVLRDYLYYYINSPAFLRPLHQKAKGAVQKYVNTGDIKENEIAVPSFDVQRKIAGILSAYDDLIENNLRRIRILEEMAQSLYREWFVHFRFPGHESTPLVDSPLGPIPEGWEVVSLLDYADVIYGFAFKSRQFNTDGEGEPVIRIRDIPNDKSATFTLEEGDPKHRVKNGDILVGMDGDFHMTIWAGGDAWQNQRVAKFRSKGGIGTNLLFHILEGPIQYFNSTITGTTVAHLGHKHIKTIEFAVPPENILQKASDLLEPFADQVLTLKQRNQTLRQTRDLLLPKLLSGDSDS